MHMHPGNLQDEFSKRFAGSVPARNGTGPTVFCTKDSLACVAALRSFAPIWCSAGGRFCDQQIGRIAGEATGQVIRPECGMLHSHGSGVLSLEAAQLLEHQWCDEGDDCQRQQCGRAGVLEEHPGVAQADLHGTAERALRHRAQDPTHDHGRDGEKDYPRIAEDWLAGTLPERVTENELMRRYGLTRAGLASVLQRIINEGWIERLPGKGWQFLPVLSTGSAYDQGYRLRILLEPAAILEPNFQLDEVGLRRCRDEQQALVDGAVEWASPAQLFDANSHLHEVIAKCPGNVFIVDGLRRVNRLRRLMEYRKDVDRAASALRCKEHLTLIDLLLSGQREAAADFMRLLMRDAAREKAGLLKKAGSAFGAGAWILGNRCRRQQRRGFWRRIQEISTGFFSANGENPGRLRTPPSGSAGCIQSG